MGEHTHSWPSHHAGVAAAIYYLAGNYEDQPSLGDMASAAGMSAHHFQRTFKTWTGVSPKRFLQFVTLGHAKRLLDGRASVLDAALEAGLSGPGRLHDLFVACEAVTPGEYKSRGRGLEIRYGLHDGPFGRTLLGVTSRGICWLSFVKGGDDRGAVEEFSAEWPASELIEDGVSTGTAAARAFRFAMGEGAEPLRLLVLGTNFQIKVWEALLRIPRGDIVSYQDVARAMGRQGAVRAVGRAVGSNPISLLIPCHRVILKSGVIHNYRWGTLRKRAILAIEQALAEADV